MNFTHLKLFRDIALNRSVSRGAAVNDMSQSAASQHLHDLEQEFGATLLDRTTRPLKLTAAGACYLEMCRDMLRRLDEFHSSLDDLKARITGVVRVASIYSVGLSELSGLVREFRRRHPEATVDVEYLRPEKVYEAVLTDQVDLGLVSYPEAGRQMAVIPWRDEEMVVAASPYHALTKFQEISPVQLNGLSFVAFDEDLPIRHELDRYFREHHVSVDIRMHFDNVQMIKEAVAQGIGVSVLPARALEAEIAQGRLAPIHLEKPGLFRPVGILHRRKKKFQSAAQAFLNFLQEQPEKQRGELIALGHRGGDESP